MIFVLNTFQVHKVLYTWYSPLIYAFKCQNSSLCQYNLAHWVISVTKVQCLIKLCSTAQYYMNHRCIFMAQLLKPVGSVHLICVHTLLSAFWVCQYWVTRFTVAVLHDIDKLPLCTIHVCNGFYILQPDILRCIL